MNLSAWIKYRYCAGDLKRGSYILVRRPDGLVSGWALTRPHACSFFVPTATTMRDVWSSVTGKARPEAALWFIIEDVKLFLSRDRGGLYSQRSLVGTKKLQSMRTGQGQGPSTHWSVRPTDEPENHYDPPFVAKECGRVMGLPTESDGLKREASVKWELSNHLTCAWHLVMVAQVSSIGWSRDLCSPSKNLKGNWAALASSWLETRETRVRILPCQWTNSGHVTTRSMSPQCLRSPMLAFTTVTVTNWAAREWTKGPTGNTQAGGLQWQQGSHSAFHIGPTIGKTWTMFFLLSIFWVIT